MLKAIAKGKRVLVFSFAVLFRASFSKEFEAKVYVSKNILYTRYVTIKN